MLISLGNYTVSPRSPAPVILAVLFYGALLIVEWLLGRCSACAARRKAGSVPPSPQGEPANRQRHLAMAEGHYNQAEKLPIKGPTTATPRCSTT